MHFKSHRNDMKLKVRKAVKKDKELLYTLILELSNPEILTPPSFDAFFEDIIKLENSDVWVFEIKEEIIGYALINKCLLLRYLGFVAEIEEIVVGKKYRRKGYGEKFINLLFEKYSLDKSCRKIAIKTNDIKGSARLYERIFDTTDLIYFQSFLNKI